MMHDASSPLAIKGRAKATMVRTIVGHGEGSLGSFGWVKYHVARRVPTAVATEADSTCKSRNSGNSSITNPDKKAMRGGMNLPLLKSAYFLNKLDTTNQTFSFLSRRRRVK